VDLPRSVRIVEVGPRDGLQNEQAAVPTETRIAFIDRLSDTGLQAIEATAFVSPKWVPQMADNAAVMAGITRKEGVGYPVLVPNMKGFEAALDAGAAEIAVFAAASETFSNKNINCGIAESLVRFRPVTDAAKANGIRVRGYISCVLGCPYEGDIAPRATAGDSPGTSTIPTARRSPISLPAWNTASPSSTVPSRASAAAPMLVALPATSPPRTCSTCSRDSASRLESISIAS
jgi:hydroxymethylglutaryl-CoA lyase